MWGQQGRCRLLPPGNVTLGLLCIIQRSCLFLFFWDYRCTQVVSKEKDLHWLTTQIHSVWLCLYVVDPATLLASNSVLAPYIPLSSQANRLPVFTPEKRSSPHVIQLSLGSFTQNSLQYMSCKTVSNNRQWWRTCLCSIWPEISVCYPALSVH